MFSSAEDALQKLSQSGISETAQEPPFTDMNEKSQTARPPVKKPATDTALWKSAGSRLGLTASKQVVCERFSF